MAEHDQAQRTEQPTPRRRGRAQEKGQVARSPDVTGAAALGASLLVLTFAGQHIVNRLLGFTQFTLGQLDGGWKAATVSILPTLGWAILPIAVGSAVIAFGVGWAHAGGAMTPLDIEWERLDPIKKFRELFMSMNAIIELAKAMVKFLVVGAIAFFYLRGEIGSLLEVPATPFDVATHAVGLIFGLGFRVAIAYAVIAVADYFISRMRHEEGLKMSKQEVRDEMKQEEGDPAIRRKRRERHRALARGKMLLDVPKADVVLVNPTEYAVALKYAPDRMNAPRVIAKGRLHLAARIREIARKTGVPIVSNPPLTRLLFFSVEVGRDIPIELYRAVAEVLAFVYRLRRSSPFENRSAA